MKKILTLLLALICLLGLVGCDPGSRMLDADDLLRNTVKIELVHYENTNPKLLRRGRKKTPDFDFSKTILIATLDESRFEDLINDVAANQFLVFGTTLNEPIGKTLILYQRDGTMVVLFSCVYQNKKGGTRYYGECNIYDENGMYLDFLGDVSSTYVDELEAKHFETDT